MMKIQVNLIIIIGEKMKLVSACLVGIRCNFEGKSFLNEECLNEFKNGNYFPVCAEVMGGLETPRIPAEIIGGDGNDVLEDKARVIREDGIDVTDEFIKGAKKVLEIANALKIKEAVLVEKSPSCGNGTIFDGTFSFKFKRGDGVTAALLKKNGIKINTIHNKV
jgi:uncharacterized protein YbbK (DUF523 family)